jgi:DNA helicase-2/ATP-dependent DNA helicase PcrA
MDDLQRYYRRLNEEQREVVDRIKGPLLVLAGPGTGKTQLLSVRAASILREAPTVRPDNILILTFTNAAARAMRERLALMIGHSGYNIEIETFHSFANSIVLRSERAVRFVKDRIQISDVEKVRALEYLMDHLPGIRELRPFGAPYIHRNEIESKISELKNEGIRPDDLKKGIQGLRPDGDYLEKKHIDRLRELASIYENYEKLKNENSDVLFDSRGRMDYDDMILIALDALGKDAGLRSEFREQYKYVMVDEYQDTNGAQLELLFSVLEEKSPNICCVGDDDQAIYRFQGASLSNFRRLKSRFEDIQEITLRLNYRSTDGVMEVSRSIIDQIPADERISVKDLRPERHYDDSVIAFREFLTEEEELAYLVSTVKKRAADIASDSSLEEEQRGRPYNNIAVLVRKRAHILKVIDAFLKAGIPYATDGQEDIGGEKRVRQMMNVLDLVYMPDAELDEKALPLYKVLTADYVKADHSDVLKFITFANRRHREELANGDRQAGQALLRRFHKWFGVFNRDGDGAPHHPSAGDSAKLDITRKLELRNPHPLHRVAWALDRLMRDSGSRPAHDMLMGYVADMNIYGYLLERFDSEHVLLVRDLRALVAFINMVKQADMADPGIGLEDLMGEMDLRRMHNMPIKGEMATMSQDGVRIYTAHSSKGLEFHTVILPFCLDQKSWPVRKKGEVIRVPAEIFKSREKVREKNQLKQLELYDELRLFYVASTRAKSDIIYSATPAGKSVISRFFEKMDIEPVLSSPDDEASFLLRYLKREPESELYRKADDVLRDMVKGMALNPTSVNNYLQCRRKFLYDNVLRLPGKKNQHLIFGNCAHKALEEVYSDFMASGVFPDFGSFRDHFIRELEYQGAARSVRKWCLAKLEKTADWYAGQSSDPVMPLGLENKIEISLPDGLRFRGTFDKIEPDGEDAVKVVDYKTGKPDDHIKAIANCRDLASAECDDYYRQLVAYKLLYEEKHGYSGKRVSRGVLQFLEPVGSDVKKYSMVKGTYRDQEVVFTDGQVSELRDLLARCWREIRDLEFAKLEQRDHRHRCVRCEYDNICWGG